MSMVLLLAVLMFFFVFGDCLPGDGACLASKEAAARHIPYVVTTVYLVGVVVLLVRWFLKRAR
jgi:hypothetical protein